MKNIDRIEQREKVNIQKMESENGQHYRIETKRIIERECWTKSKRTKQKQHWNLLYSIQFEEILDRNIWRLTKIIFFACVWYYGAKINQHSINNNKKKEMDKHNTMDCFISEWLCYDCILSLALQYSVHLFRILPHGHFTL